MLQLPPVRDEVTGFFKVTFTGVACFRKATPPSKKRV
jgi:hypothetical protein